MDKTILITRPDHDITTRYLSKWCQKVIDLALKKGIKVLDLRREKVNEKELTSRISKMKPSLIVLNGHGDDDRVTGHDNDILVISGRNEKILKDKIVYAISCRSALILGPRSIVAGALSYIGYRKDFVFYYQKDKIARPLEDDIAKLFLEPSNQTIISLIKGHTSKASSNNSKRTSMRTIHKLMSSESSAESGIYARYLLWNMVHQVCLGNENSNL